MTATWMVNVGGRAYGPYTDAQMAAYAAEGRLAPQSLVAREGEVEFRAAGEDAALAALFGKPDEGNAQGMAKPAELRFGGAFGKKEEGQKGERSQLVVIADMKSGSISGLEEQIHKLGQAYTLLPQVWLLRTDQSANSVRNHLVQFMGKLDVLFVVDASNNKTAWFNFGPEPEARIRRIWTKSEAA
jgi:hypothetical protein